MKTIYLFDVDGTLTPAKSTIDPAFGKQFLKWCSSREVYIVSGGSFTRIIDQLGRSIFDKVHGVFACMGNVYYRNMFNKTDGYSAWIKVYENTFVINNKQSLLDDLDWTVKDSPFHIKTGKHHEERTGMLNFSIVGRNASTKQRNVYCEYDQKFNERRQIVDRLSPKYPELDFVIGGAVSIDIYQKGNDKSQVIRRTLAERLEDNQIVFVGDRVSYPGNDYPLAKILEDHPNGLCFGVASWRDTSKLLETDLFASS